MLFVIGATPKFLLGRERRIVVETGLEAYFGSVGYNGGLQGVNQAGQNVIIPGTSSTGYLGFEANPRAGYIFSLGNRFQLTRDPRPGWRRSAARGS
jgi:hypothetical protein